MSQLYAGFSRVNITPMLGIELAGYYKTRHADGVLDELEINAFNLVLTHELIKLIKVHKDLFDRRVENIHTKDRIKVILKIKWIVSKKEKNKLKWH